MKHIMMSILAIVFPWAVLLIHDNPGGAIVALVLQATGVGWIPASIWAWRIVQHADRSKSKPQADTEN